jgi:hypothetical protein
MSNKTIDKCLELLNRITNNSNTLSDKEIGRILKELFIPILQNDGYIIDRDSMRRHGYLAYIASKGKKTSKHTIGVAFNKQENILNNGDIENLVAGCTIDGIDSLIFVSNALLDFETKKFDEDVYPVKFQHVDFITLRNWIESLEIKEAGSKVIDILKECTQHIIMAILNNPNLLMDLEWLDIERMVAELFRGIGFRVELTPATKDGGKDIILELEEKVEKRTYIIEIKHWRSKQKAGKKVIDKFVKIVVKEKRTAGLFLSTYGVSDDAVASLTIIERKKVKFADKEKIISLCETYIQKQQSGLWLKNLELEKLLFENTL